MTDLFAAAGVPILTPDELLRGALACRSLEALKRWALATTVDRARLPVAKQREMSAVIAEHRASLVEGDLYEALDGADTYFEFCVVSREWMATIHAWTYDARRARMVAALNRRRDEILGLREAAE